jgi:hypothetical protein
VTSSCGVEEIETYGKYIELLLQEFGIDLQVYRETIGPPGGIYADTGYLLCKLISSAFVGNVLEIGSGLSTLLLTKTAHTFGKHFTSLENVPEWAGVACGGLSKLELPITVVSTAGDLSKCPTFEAPFDLVWVDGELFSCRGAGVSEAWVGRIGACAFYRRHLRGAVLIFDDAQSRAFKETPQLVSEFLGRDSSELLWYNPCGREDRHQAISLPALSHPAYETIREVERIQTKERTS